jgi:hypothetical protein
MSKNLAEDFKDFILKKKIYKKEEFYFKGSLYNNFKIIKYAQEVDSICLNCETQKTFKSNYQQGNVFIPHGGSNALEENDLKEIKEELSYSCVSCGLEKIINVSYFKNKDCLIIYKFGEYPQMDNEYHKDKNLEKFLEKDLDNYNKAIKSINEDLGVAAFNYLRRIIENNIMNLFELVEADIENSSGEITEDFKIEKERIKTKLEKLGNYPPMSENIKIAQNAIPRHLYFGDQNPFSILYACLSEGVHSLEDQECLEQAEDVLACLAFLVSSLYSRNLELEKYKDKIKRVSLSNQKNKENKKKNK